MTGRLGLSDQELKTAVSNTKSANEYSRDYLRTDSNVSREIKILIKNQREMLEITHTVTEIKNSLDRLISRQGIAEEKNL